VRTPDAIRAWLLDEVSHAGEGDPDEQACRRRVVAEPALQDAERRYLARAEHSLADMFASDLGLAGLHVRMAAAAVLALLVVIGAEGDARLVADDGWTPEHHPMALLDDALRFVAAGAHRFRLSSSTTSGFETRGS
jgi:hypothetical protein